MSRIGSPSFLRRRASCCWCAVSFGRRAGLTPRFLARSRPSAVCRRRACGAAVGACWALGSAAIFRCVSRCGRRWFCGFTAPGPSQVATSAAGTSLPELHASSSDDWSFNLKPRPPPGLASFSSRNTTPSSRKARSITSRLPSLTSPASAR